MKLTVLYDASCGLCWRARRWLENQSTYVPLEFLAAGSEAATERYPGLDVEETRRVLHVVADDGRVWKAARAWVVCLWAVRKTRGFALSLRTPARMVLAQRFVLRISENRYLLSKAFGWKPVQPLPAGLPAGSLPGSSPRSSTAAPGGSKDASASCDDGICELT